MKIIRFAIFVLFFFSISGIAISQNLKENELVVIQGKKFILHQVLTGETVYSISRNFKVDSSELLQYNPDISKGLSIGDVLKIPFNENVELSELPKIKKGDPTGYVNYTIASNSETAYSISKTYGITVEEIYAYNPAIRKFKKGVTLKIPQWNYESKPGVTTEPEPAQAVVSSQTAKQGDMLEHTVVSGETLYSIGKKYHVSESDILYYNPDAKNLKAGSKLYLPKKADENKTAETVTSGNENIIMHTIVSGETLYGITKKYKVSEAELISLNPDLKTGFRTGAKIRIPVSEGTTKDVEKVGDAKPDVVLNQPVVPEAIHKSDIPESCRPDYKKRLNETVNIALFLPLFIEANENLNKDLISKENNLNLFAEPADSLGMVDGIVADTIIEEEKPVHLFKQFYGNSEKFLQFYEGVILAVDSMQKAGMQIKLNVYDTKENPEAIRGVVNSERFKSIDLIIGPVYEHVQKEVARVASENHIPMVSPFTPKSDVIRNNQQFYQINPTREYLLEATAGLIAANDTNINFVVLQTSPFEGTPEGQLVDIVRRKFESSDHNGRQNFTVYDFRKERARGLPRVLKPDKENYIFIPSSDEGELSVAISNINNVARDFPVTLIGAANYQQKYPSIEVAHFHNLKLNYLNPYWVDYQDKPTVAYFEKFISNFGTEPGSYGVQGFDAAWYFLNALYYYGKDFENCLPYIHVKLLQGNYYFQKVSQGGGYMNKGVSLISYTPDFEVVRKKVIGQPKFGNGF